MFTNNTRKSDINQKESQKNFDLTVPIIYKEIISLNQENNTSFIKSLTTIATVYDLNKYKIFEKEAVKSRAYDYALVVKEFLEISNFKDQFDDWVDFLLFLYLKTKKDFLYLDKEQELQHKQKFDQEFADLMIDCTTQEIVREISSDEKEIAKEIIRNIIKQNINFRGRYFHLVIKKILENKKKISVAIKDSIKIKHQKNNFFSKILRFLGWDSKVLYNSSIKNVVQKFLDKNLSFFKRRIL